MEGGSKEQCGPRGMTREKEERVCGGGKSTPAVFLTFEAFPG